MADDFETKGPWNIVCIRKDEARDAGFIYGRKCVFNKWLANELLKSDGPGSWIAIGLLIPLDEE